MNVVHVVESLERGGLERVVCDLVQEQVRAGHCITVVCLFTDGLLADEARRAGAPVVAIRKRTGLDPAALMRLRRELNACQADVIHTHNATAHYHAAFMARRRGHAVLVNTRHGMGGERRSDRRERLYSMALGRTAAVAAVCQAAADRMVADGIVPAGLMRVVPNGIRVDAFGLQDRLDARRRLGVTGDGLVIGTVGRLNWAKDHAFLLRACQEYVTDDPAASVVIVGKGEERDELERMTAALGLQGRVRFLGDRSDVASLLPGMDIFALSSRTEGHSIALLEASAAGVAMIATDVGGNREIVQHRSTGLLVPHGDLQGFAGALRELAQSPSLRSGLGAAARVWAAANASLGVMAQRYERLYADCGVSTTRLN